MRSSTMAVMAGLCVKVCRDGGSGAVYLDEAVRPGRLLPLLPVVERDRKLELDMFLPGSQSPCMWAREMGRSSSSSPSSSS